MNAADVPIPVFIQSLLKACKLRGITVAMVYAHQEDGQQKVKMTGNAAPAAVAMMLGHVSGMDVGVLAKALHELRIVTADRCLLCADMGYPDDSSRSFEGLSKGSQQRHEEAAQTLLDASRGPRIKDPSAPPPV